VTIPRRNPRKSLPKPPLPLFFAIWRDSLGVWPLKKRRRMF